MSPAALTDDEIVAIWRANRRWVAAVIHAHKPADVDIDDLLQEVAVKLVRNIHALDDPEAIRPWLRTVAVNAARSAGRRTRSKVKAHAAVDFEHSPDRTGHLGQPIDQPGRIRAVEDGRARGRRALELAESLPMHYREPLLLSLRGMSQKQIAEALAVPVTTVETRLIRARKMIRSELVGDDRNMTDSGGSRVNNEYVGSEP